MTFLSTLPSTKENFVPESNPVRQTLHMHLSESTVLANLTLPNKQSFKVKSEFKLRVSN